RRPVYTGVDGADIAESTRGPPMQSLAQRQQRPAARRIAGRVAVLYTSAHTVLPDIARLMELAGVRDALDPAAPTALKVNISWQRYYPACSTSPWQLDGTIRG